MRPWRICVYDNDGGVRVDEAHSVAARLTANDRNSVLAEAVELVDMLDPRAVEWEDHVPERERLRWNSPLEMLLKARAWSQIKYVFPEALAASIEDALEAEGLPRSALRCLDDDDREDLQSVLNDAAVSAFQSGDELVPTLRRTLVDWLLDWTKSDVDHLSELVQLTQEMAGLDERRSGVNWIAEGF